MFKFLRLGVTASLLLTWLLLPGNGYAQITIHGTLSGALGPGAYIVDGDIQVTTGQSLTINPGTTFLHTGHYTWNIYGQFNSVGTERQPIRFIRQFPYEAHKWGGLRFYEGASSQGIEWCQFDYYKNTTYPNYDGGAVNINRVNNLTFRNCAFTNGQASSGGAIYASFSDSLIIDNCVVARNTAGNGAGILLYYCNAGQITNCLIKENVSTST